MGLGFAGGAPLILLADVFATGLDLLGGLCVAAGWPWLAGSSVPSAMEAQHSLSCSAQSLLTPCPLPPLMHPTQQKSSTRPSHPLPLPPPAVTSVPKLKPSHLQAPCHFNTSPRHRGIYHTPAQCTQSWTWRKESDTGQKTALSSRSASHCHQPGLVPQQARLAGWQC